MNVAVFYVWVPGDRFAEHTRRFVDSYRNHEAGTDHDLIIIAKCDRLPTLVPALPGKCVPVGEGGFDIGPFLTLARSYRDHDRLVMLSAYTRFRADGWLEKLVAAGPISAPTGSWEVRPHLRTSSFSVDPRILKWMPSRVVTKEETWAFEHGPHSLYRTAFEHGLQGAVVGRDGNAYGELDWPASRTFRIGGQENLLLADNHTDIYAQASPAERAQLTARTWDPSLRSRS